MWPKICTETAVTNYILCFILQDFTERLSRNVGNYSFPYCFIHKDVTDYLYGNSGDWLPINAAWHHRSVNFTFTTRWKLSYVCSLLQTYVHWSCNSILNTFVNKKEGRRSQLKCTKAKFVTYIYTYVHKHVMQKVNKNSPVPVASWHKSLFKYWKVSLDSCTSLFLLPANITENGIKL